MGHFLFAAKAFDVLERLDPDPEYWEGKRGACVGVFQLVIAGKASRDDLQVRVRVALFCTMMRFLILGRADDDPQHFQSPSGVHRAHHQEMVQRKQCQDNIEQFNLLYSK